MQKLKSYILILATAIVSCCYNLPQLTMVIKVPQMAMITAAFALVIIADCWKNIRKSAGYVLLYGLIMFIVAIPFDFKYGFMHPVMLLWISIFPSILAIYLFERHNKFELAAIALFNIVLYMYVGRATLSFMAENPTVLRDMTSGTTDEEVKNLLSMGGCARFGYAYASGGVLLTAIGLLYYCIKEKQVLWKLFVLAALAILAAYICFRAMFTTLLLLIIISLLVMFWKRIPRGGMRFFFAFAIAILLFVWKDLIVYIAGFYEGSPVYFHLMDLVSGVSESSERTQLQWDSFMAFMGSPLWGNNVDGELNFLYTHAHSNVLPIALATGALGVFCYYKSFWMHFVAIIKKQSAKIKEIFWLPLTVFFWSLTVLNPTNSNEFSWLFFFICPMLIFYFSYNEQETLVK